MLNDNDYKIGAPGTIRQSTIASLWHVARVNGPSLGCASHDAEVLELPRVGVVDVFLEEPPAVLERRPVRVLADDLAQVGIGDIEHSAVVEVIGLYHAAAGILQHPDQR